MTNYYANAIPLPAKCTQFVPLKYKTAESPTASKVIVAYPAKFAGVTTVV
jgi:hypothetical protein